ncbi:uncharacterized protein LOC110713393 [Chenopodium quinoa]|uniref:Uncharacterized protein n=1 Tax=Chenopodium quinoa TaxID=63459 RepID=A0A803MQX9_CHEQI|nr:uncharacterized protein LOC110713393 [Chenopodium quinoa]
MKTVLLSPKSLQPISMEDNRSNFQDERETNYFPDCRKDANCTCKMCLDSITATLDLMSMSVQRSSLTKLSASKPVVDITPVSIDPTLLSTPISKTPPIADVASSKTVVRSTAKTVELKIVEPKKRKFGLGWKFLRWVLLIGLILGLEFGFSWGVIRVLRPRLSGEILRDIVEESSGVVNLSDRLILIQKKMNDFVDGTVSSCNLGDSSWEINQNGLISMSYCTLYKSAAEEVLIWGWPLQTAGLLTAEFSSRSFKVLSGRITEWPEGKIIYTVREANTTWILRKWSASVVQFEPNTWIIEYSRNSV